MSRTVRRSRRQSFVRQGGLDVCAVAIVVSPNHIGPRNPLIRCLGVGGTIDEFQFTERCCYNLVTSSGERVLVTKSGWPLNRGQIPLISYIGGTLSCH
eukprot:sb/3478863/